MYLREVVNGNYCDLDIANQTFELVSSMFSFQVFRCFGSFFQVLFQTAVLCMVNYGPFDLDHFFLEVE